MNNTAISQILFKLRPSPFFILFFLFGIENASAQAQAKNWLFGNAVGLVFNTSSISLTSGAITTTLGCSSISDNQGNLLFYSDGQTVYTASHTVMANGTGLNGTADQSALIIKQPGSANLYYLFTTSTQSNVAGLSYSIIDMTLASGAGSVTVKNASVMNGSGSGKLTAGKHCNGTDVWVVSSNSVGTNAYLLTSNGISANAVTSTFASTSRGTLKISPNSKRIATAALGSAPSAMIAQFDNATGAISSPTNLFVYNLTPNSTDGPYGIEFSADGSKLYYYSWQGCTLLQYDLCTSITSGTCIGSYQGETLTSELNTKKTLQLGPDKKIYMTLGGSYSATATGSNVLGVINAPNQLGNACNFSHNGLSLGTYTSGWGLPNFPGYYFEMKPGGFISHTANIQSCTTVSFSTGNVCSGTGYTLTGLLWNFGDPGSASNTSTLVSPNHQFSSTGTYTVKLIRYFSDCNNTTDTVYKTISVTQPTLSVITSSAPCAVNISTASVAGGSGSYSYTWSPGNYSTAVATLSAAGIYTLYVNDQLGGCAATRTVQVPIIQLQATIQSNSISCYGGTALATVTGSNGSGQYSYLWSNASTSPTNQLSAGNYTIIITDILYGCQKQVSLTLQQPSIIYSGIVITPTPACQGNSIAVTCNLMGGTPPYTILWNNLNTGASYTQVANTNNTTYSAIVIDANNCQHSTSIYSLSVSNLPTLTISGNTICNNQPINLFVSGAMNFTWQPGNFYGNNYQPTFSTQGYTVFGEQNGCVTQSLVSIINAPPIQLNVFNNSPVCEGDSILLNSSSGLTYHWFGPLGYGSILQNPSIPSASLINAGTYTLQVSDAFGCKDSATIGLTVNSKPKIIFTGNFTLCAGESTTLVASGGQIYSWSGGGSQPAKVINSLFGSVYSLTVTNNFGCKSDTTIQLKVNACENMIENYKELLSVNPIPANQSIKLNFVLPIEDATIRFFDMNGKEVLHYSNFNGQNVVVLTSEWPSGIYYLKVLFKTTALTTKVIVMH